MAGYAGETRGIGEGAARGADTGAAYASAGLEDHLRFVPFFTKCQKTKENAWVGIGSVLKRVPLASPCAATVSGLGAPERRSSRQRKGPWLGRFSLANFRDYSIDHRCRLLGPTALGRLVIGHIAQHDERLLGRFLSSGFKVGGFGDGPGVASATLPLLFFPSFGLAAARRHILAIDQLPDAARKAASLHRS